MSLSAEEIRAGILGYGKKTVDVDTPFWPKFDGKLAVREMNGEESLAFEKNSDDPKVIGRIIVSCLQTRDTHQQIFPLREAEFIMREIGLSALRPILEKIAEVSNVKRKNPEVNVTDEAEGNSEATQGNDSTTN